MTAPAPCRIYGDPYGTRTHICSVRGCRPNRLDEEAMATWTGFEPANLRRDRAALYSVELPGRIWWALPELNQRERGFNPPLYRLS